MLKVERRATVVAGHAALTIARHHADIVFLDPPYDQEREYTAVLEQLAEAPPGLLIVQHSVRFDLPEHQGPLHRTRTLRQGDNALSFYTAPQSPAPNPHPLLSHSVDAAVPRDTAWAFMSNVSNWADPPAEFSLDGPFADGSRGATVMPGQPVREWHLRDVRPPETYTVVGDLGGADAFLHLDLRADRRRVHKAHPAPRSRRRKGRRIPRPHRGRVRSQSGSRNGSDRRADRALVIVGQGFRPRVAIHHRASTIIA